MKTRAAHILVVLATYLIFSPPAGAFPPSTDGTGWTRLTTRVVYISSLVASGENLYAGTIFGDLLLSKNAGAIWTVIDSGLPDAGIWSFSVCGATLFAGTVGRGVFR